MLKFYPFSPIDRICDFGLKAEENISNFAKLSNSQRQLLSIQLEKEKAKARFQQQEELKKQRRMAFKEKIVSEKKKEIEEKRKLAEEYYEQAKVQNEKIIQNQLNISSKTTNKKDFFGRKIDAAAPKKTNNTCPASYEKYTNHSVFFKFQEGFTNAVRRTVYVKDFV